MECARADEFNGARSVRLIQETHHCDYCFQVFRAAARSISTILCKRDDGMN